MSPDILRLRSPADVVCAIPYLIGFHPADSVVVLACDGTRGAHAVRLDLTASEALLDHIAGLVIDRRPDAVILAGYGPAGRVTPVIDQVRGRLHEGGVRVREALRVEDGRFWSYLCADTECCPPEGTRVDPATNPVTATAIARGLVALPARRELERLVAPSGGTHTRRATTKAEQHLARWAAEDPGTVPDRMIREGLPLVRRLLTQAYEGAPPPSDEEVAWLGVLMTNVRVRDEAWARIREPELDVHTTLWRHVLTRVAEPYAPAPACLLSYAAWRAGEGALANVALDRALAADPSYSMARLLGELFISGLTPSSVPLNLTPEQLDEPA